MTELRWSHFLWVAALSCAIWFFMLGSRDLFDPDEGRYAEIPAGMVDSGDWLTPRLNGIKYFEKPVLQYWLTAAVYSVAGKSNASARFAPALLGFLSALFAAFVAFRLYGRKPAFYTLLITLSCLFWVALGHILTVDMTLSGFLVAGMGCLAIAQHDRGNRKANRAWMLLGWSALALAVLTKGLIGVVLPVGAVVIYTVWQRDLDIWKNLHLGKGLLLFLAITAPWFVAVSMANPEFAHFFFVHEHWDRYTSEVHNREGPVYYFVPFLLVGLIPWLINCLAALAKPSFRWMPPDAGQFDAARLLWCFITLTFIFFSLGSSKLPAYILPIVPLVAILAGDRLARRQTLGGDRWVTGLFGLLLVALSFTLDQLANERYSLQIWENYQPWVLASGLLLVLSAAAAFALKRRILAASTLVSLSALLAFQMLLWGGQSLAQERSSRAVANAILAAVQPGAPVFMVRTFPESVAFYLGRTTRVVQYTGELEFGLTQEPQKAIGNLDEFVSEWNRLESAAMIVNTGRWADLFPGIEMGRVVYTGPKQTVVVKP